MIPHCAVPHQMTRGERRKDSGTSRYTTQYFRLSHAHVYAEPRSWHLGTMLRLTLQPTRYCNMARRHLPHLVPSLPYLCQCACVSCACVSCDRVCSWAYLTRGWFRAVQSEYVVVEMVCTGPLTCTMLLASHITVTPSIVHTYTHERLLLHHLVNLDMPCVPQGQPPTPGDAVPTINSNSAPSTPRLPALTSAVRSLVSRYSHTLSCSSPSMHTTSYHPYA